jgi:hypothetical protein
MGPGGRGTAPNVERPVNVDKRDISMKEKQARETASKMARSLRN